MPRITGDVEHHAEFCIAKCGEGYCSYMSGRGGFPCVEFLCAFCSENNIVGASECAFCKTGVRS